MNTEIILEIFLILIGLYLALFKSYFQEKGKNIATSEDIEDLTLKVESVKQQFIEKNATLKAKLDLLTNLQINHKNDERLALINFHKKLKSWIGLLTESSPSLVDDYDNQEILSKIHHYQFTYSEVRTAQAMLELYIKDEELIKLINDLIIITLENLNGLPSIYLHELRHNNVKIEQLESELDLDKKTEKHKELLDERKALFTTNTEKMLEGYKKVIPKDKEYGNYLREYLAKFSEE
ncbi:hypothetical protein [Polaribacter sp. Asnod1-A03]|uniref:hypothetical protein n=1 Tax=Polaribacter sp. Asnod1-A03 TaxID=3160581 RepID=UPI00386DD3BB